MSASVQVEGLAELDAKLAQLDAVGAKKVLDQTVRASMKPVLAEAQRLVPVSKESGPHLRDALTITVRKQASAGAVSTATLRVKKLPARVRRFLKALRKRGFVLAYPTPRRYWHLVEFGTSRTSPKPFIRPAIDGQKGELLAVLKRDLSKRIDRAVKGQAPEGG